MIAFATGRYTILRGTPTVNEYNDEINVDTPIKSGVRGSIVEQAKTNYDSENGRVATYYVLTGRFPNGSDIQEGDRIQDESNGDKYLVDVVQRPTQIFGKSDLVLELTFNG